jgi:hypothetical protein
MPLVWPGFSTSSNKRFKKKVKTFDQSYLTLLFIGCLISISFISQGYQFPSSSIDYTLNLDSISRGERELLLFFIENYEIKNSIILAETPTWRYLNGLMGDWPPKSQTFWSNEKAKPVLYNTVEGKIRLHSFNKLIFDGDNSLLIELGVKENVDNIYLVKLNRLSNDFDNSNFSRYSDKINYLPIKYYNEYGNIYQMNFNNTK